MLPCWCPRKPETMPFAIALILSAALHAAALAVPDWDLPTEAEPEPMVEAHLAPAPKPSLPAHAEKAKAPVRHLPPAALAAPPAVPPQAVAGPAPEPAVSAPPTPPVPATLPWGGRGRIRYAVSRDDGFYAGEATQDWQAQDGHYRLRWAFEPKGLVAMFGSTRTQLSEGEIDANGLRPDRFSDQKGGREAEAASFDWPSGRVSFSGGRGEAALPAGAEDLLSVFYQLAWLAPRQNLSLTVVTGSRIGRWNFEYLGEETLSLPAGTGPALHLRTQADGKTIEVWLSVERGYLPLKIRFIDGKGGILDQLAQEMETH